MDPGFTVAHVVVDDRPVQVHARGGRIALPEGSEHTVVIEYHGRLAPLPREGEAIGPVAGPEGSYLPAGWFPTFGDLFDYEVSIDVPDSQCALVPGRLTAETTAGGRYRATFSGVAPVAELPLFAGPYKIAETLPPRLATPHLLPRRRHRPRRHLPRAHVRGYLDLYDGWIGAYAYPGFSVVSSPFPVGLAFPGMTYLGSQVLRLPFIPDTSLGHEVLHSWWGDGVRVDGRDGNWAEGLTTFMADYTYTERRGGEAAREQRLAWLREFAILPAAEDRPLDTFRGRMHTASQATGYHKAALRLRDAARPDRTGRVRDCRAPLLAGASSLRRELERSRGRVQLGSRRPLAGGVLRAVADPVRRAAPRARTGRRRWWSGLVHAVAGRAAVRAGRPGGGRDGRRAGRSHHPPRRGEPELRRRGHGDAPRRSPSIRTSASSGTSMPSRSRRSCARWRSTRRAVAVVAASDPASRTAAGELAASFFERQPEVQAADAALPPRASARGRHHEGGDGAARARAGRDGSAGPRRQGHGARLGGAATGSRPARDRGGRRRRRAACHRPAAPALRRPELRRLPRQRGRREGALAAGTESVAGHLGGRLAYS